MAQFNTNYNPSLIATRGVNDELFFETYMKTQELVSDSPSTMVRRSDELKCNLAMIFNLKKNLDSLKNVLSQSDLKDDQFHNQMQCSKELKVRMEFLLNKMHLPLQKKAILVSHHAKKKKRSRKSKEHECQQVKSFIKPKVVKKKPILLGDVENLCRNNDIRLSEVISRRNEAQKFLNFLQDVTQLRKVKISNAKVEGRAYSEEKNADIEKILDGMKDKWTILMNEYTLEERSLKEMMKDDSSNNLSHTAKLHYWERLLFGDDIGKTSYDGLDQNLKKYYALLRCMWDESIDVNKGVNLPLGWVMPQEPIHPAWSEYCQTD